MPRYQRVPPRRPLSWAHTLRHWSALLVAGALVAALVSWSERLPAPLAADAPAGEFSAARAMPTLVHLADTLGHRLPGTPASARARERLVARLRATPGVEVTVQDAVGVRATRAGPLAYRVQNVLARIPGREAGAVMLAAHYDSPASSVGAADDAVAVAAAIEVARAIAAGPRPRHTVLLNLNDGEEQGLLGAHAFVRHPWAREVRAYLNLESAGNEGKAILFQAGPQNAWLTRRYAGAVPHPYGSVIGQDIFQSGFIPSSTDFEVYAQDGGLRGLDVAFYRGGWAYHTPLDRAAAIAPGSVQHVGANALAAVRALAEGPLPGDVAGSPSVYYDLLGVAMLAYDRRAAWLVAAAAAVLLLVGIAVAMRRHDVPLRLVLVAFAHTLLGAVLAIGAAVALAAVAPYALGRGHGWFAHPWRAGLAYGGIAVAVLLAAYWRLNARRTVREMDPDGRWVAGWVAALLVHLVLLATFTVAGIGSGYLFAWWAASGALGLLLFARGGRRWPLAGAVGNLLPALLTAQTATLLVALFAPVAGRFPLAIPFDLVIAAIVATAAVVLGLAPLALLQRAGRVGLAAALFGVAGLVGLLVLALSSPYAPHRPQRIAIAHESDETGSSLVVRGADWVGPRRAVAAVADWPLGAPTIAGEVASFPAPPLGQAAPSVEVLADRVGPNGRELDLRVLPNDAFRVTLRTARAVRWRVAGDAERTWHEGTRAAFVAAPDSGWVVTVAVPDAAPLGIEASAHRHGTTEAAADLARRLPAWTTATTESVARTRLTF